MESAVFLAWNEFNFEVASSRLLHTLVSLFYFALVEMRLFHPQVGLHFIPTYDLIDTVEFFS